MSQISHFRPALRRSLPRVVALLGLCQIAALGVAMPSVGSRPVQAQEARRVSLDFVGADVHTVAKALSIQSGVNVVVMPSITGKVTIRLTQVPLEDALRRVAAAVGSDVRKMEDTYFLGSTVELRAMIAKSGGRQAVALKHTPAAEVQKLLQAALPYLTVEAVEKANIVVLTGTEDDLAVGARMAREADVAPPPTPVPAPPVPEIMRDAYTVKWSKADQLAQTLQRAMPDLKITQNDKALVLEGPKGMHEQAMKILVALDTRESADKVTRAYTLKFMHPHQAAFTIRPLYPNITVAAGFEAYSPSKVIFTPLSIDAGEIFSQQGLQGGQNMQGGGGGAGGVSGGAGAAGGATQPGALPTQQDLIAPGFRSRTVILQGSLADVESATQVLSTLDQAPQQVLIEARVVDMSPETAKRLGFLYDWTPLSFTETKTGSNVSFGSLARSAFGFNVELQAAEERREAKILARPNIAVIDGEEASIFIGDLFRYERVTSVSDSGQQVFTIETVPIGVALLCRPRVTGDEITLRVHPVVSNIRSFTGRNGDIPVTSSREAESVVRMKDGETFAIGGLLKDEELKIMTKVPILGDLPFLGQLFRHRNTSKKRSEVTIFITARIRKD